MRHSVPAMMLALLLMMMASRTASAAPALLEVWVNGKSGGAVVAVTRDGGHLLVAGEDIEKLNLPMPLRADAQGRCDLSQVPGLSAQVDENGQRLLLTVAAQSLPRQTYDLAAGAGAVPAPQSDTGAILRYDLSASAADRLGRTVAGGASVALDIFTPDYRIANSGFVTANVLGVRPVRLDSALVLERPQRLSHVILGDAISVTQEWGRAVRFGGIQWASDFGLRPGLVTQPLPAFFGQSEVPATVDVFSGAARLYQQEIAPGPFELRNLPVLTGGGGATIVTRDVLGRETTQTISLYTDAGLLAPGLESFALDAGFLRTGYGRSSFGYDTPMLSGDWRRGLSDRLTLQAHGEAAPGLFSLGGGGEMGLGFGSIAAGLAASTGAQAGLLASLSANLLAGPFTLYGQGQASSRGWRDLASLSDGGLPPPRLRYQLGATTGLDWGGTLGVSWIGSKYQNRAARQLLSASWQAQLPRGAFLALSALKDLQSGIASVQVSLNMPLGGRALAGLSAATDKDRASGLATIDSPADPDGGFGYRLAGGWQDGTRLQGEAAWIGRHVGLDGGVSLDRGQTSFRADASGALVFLRGGLFASRDPGEAVALVEAGAPGIRIYRENRPVAVSDADGEALLTGLDAWAPNRIGVEPRDYDFNTLVEKTDDIVVPRRAGGVRVDFRPVSRHPLLATVTRGIPLATPVGARVLLDGMDEPLTMGRDGQVFVADLRTPRGGVVEIGGARCRFRLEPQEVKGAMGRSDPLLCLREASGAY